MKSPVLANEKIETHFPVLFMERQFNDVAEINQELATLVREFERSGSSHRPNNKSQYNAGFSTEINLASVPNPAIKLLQGMIETAFLDYLQHLNRAGLLNLGDEALADTDGFQFRTSLWAVILRQHQWICPHSHAGGSFGGTYYVELPELEEPEGCLEFINPLGSYSSNPALATAATTRRMPAVGRMLFFPSHYLHLVYPFAVSGERISYSFTINAEYV